jgi:hypothetical protein
MNRRISWLCGLLFAIGCDGGASEAADAGGGLEALVRGAEAESRAVVRGNADWLFLTSELRFLAQGRFWGPGAASTSRAAKPEWADPLPAIEDFHRQLQGAGIELLLVPVPAKAAVVPNELPALGAPGGRLDAVAAEFYDQLRERGIDVLDLQPGFAEASEPGELYCHQDTHWSGVATERAAERIAERVRRADWYDGVARETFESERRDVTIDGDLRALLGDAGLPAESVPLRFVGRRTAGRLAPVSPERASPVLLLADSHGLVFHAGGDMHARGAGLVDQLALELGFALDLVAVRGSGATPARVNLARRSNGLEGKRLVIWAFSARELTESTQGWRKVPVVR